MENINIYEVFGISIYCTGEELINAYANYREKLIDGFENNEDIVVKNSYKRQIEQIDFEMKFNKLDSYSMVHTRKITYDRLHVTPYAILGMRHGEVPNKEKIKNLKAQYPNHKSDIEKALRTVLTIETKNVLQQNKETKQNLEGQIPKMTSQERTKFNLKNYVTKRLAAVLAVLGISVAVPKLLDTAEPKEPEQVPNTTVMPIPDENTFKESLKVANATIKKDGSIVPDNYVSNYGTISFEDVLKYHSQPHENKETINTVKNIPESVTQSIIKDPLEGFKNKLYNDEELRKIAEDALGNVSVGERYDASVYEKLDYIMMLMEKQNVDCILGTVPGMGGIKNCILDLIDDVVLYYIQKEVGQPGCFIRYSEEKKR